MPASVCAIYKHDADADILVCVGTSGDPEQKLKSLAIRRGDRITGWAAANDTTIANSDATLDLGTVAESFDPPLRSALSTPMSEAEQACGVLTVYATRPQAFADDHKYLAERVANILSARFVTFSNQPILRFRNERLGGKSKAKVER